MTCSFQFGVSPCSLRLSPKQKFENAGNEYTDQAPSDIEFEIVELPHSVFERKGNDLFTKLKISLEEALLGFSKEIIHLDSHPVLLEREKVTQPGEIQRIPGEGMPHHEYSSNFGVINALETSLIQRECECWSRAGFDCGVRRGVPRILQ